MLKLLWRLIENFRGKLYAHDPMHVITTELHYLRARVVDLEHALQRASPEVSDSDTDTPTQTATQGKPAYTNSQRATPKRNIVYSENITEPTHLEEQQANLDNGHSHLSGSVMTAQEYASINVEELMSRLERELRLEVGDEGVAVNNA
jgi:hypothetical protein